MDWSASNAHARTSVSTAMANDAVQFCNPQCAIRCVSVNGNGCNLVLHCRRPFRALDTVRFRNQTVCFWNYTVRIPELDRAFAGNDRADSGIRLCVYESYRYLVYESYV